MPVRYIGEEQDIRSLGKGVATDLVREERTAAQSPCWRIEAQDLLNDHTSKRELWQILDQRRAPVQHSPIFLLELCCDVRMLREKEERPRERVGGRFMTGYQ